MKRLFIIFIGAVFLSGCSGLEQKIDQVKENWRQHRVASDECYNELIGRYPPKFEQIARTEYVTRKVPSGNQTCMVIGPVGELTTLHCNDDFATTERVPVQRYSSVDVNKPRRDAAISQCASGKVSQMRAAQQQQSSLGSRAKCERQYWRNLSTYEKTFAGDAAKLSEHHSKRIKTCMRCYSRSGALC